MTCQSVDRAKQRFQIRFLRHWRAPWSCGHRLGAFQQWQLEDRQEAFNELTGIVALYLTDYRHVQLAIGGIKVDAEALAGERAGKPMKWTRPAVTSPVPTLICVA